MFSLSISIFCWYKLSIPLPVLRLYSLAAYYCI
nr:MAG TPA: hypothetical protein [Crassvirales sp.]